MMFAQPLRSSSPDLYHGKYVAGGFASGEQGVWYEPSLSNGALFQDAAGTIPVTAVEQPVGLMLDKRKGLAPGPELVVNGEFNSSISGWQADTGGYSTVSWNAGSLRVTSTSTASRGKSAYQEFPVIAGKLYVISGSASVISGSFTVVQIALRDGSDAGLSSFVIGTVLALTGTSTQSTYYYADSTRTLYLHTRFFNSTAPAVVDFDNISVREITGNPAYQTTSADRPVFSARYNLLTKTEDFSNTAVWTPRSGSTTRSSNTEIAPDGTLTADTLTFYDAASEIALNVSPPDGYYEFTCWVKGIPGETFAIGAASSTYGIGGTTRRVLTGGWDKFTLIINISLFARVWIGTWGATARTVSLWGASLVPANQAHLPYQRVNTATDYDADPVKFPPYLKFNGVNSWMVTPSIDFTATDKMTVFCGVRKLSDAAPAILLELSSDVNGSSGAFYVAAPSATSSRDYQYRSKAANPIAGFGGIASSGVFLSPLTNVITGISSIPSDIVNLRVNGAQVGTATADQGTGNYGNYPLFIGRRGGTSLPFNGQIYSLIIRGAATDDAHLTHTEKYIAYKTGITL